MEYFIAHDIGTSGLKSSLFSKEGNLIKSVLQEYQADFKGREVTQNPLLLFYAVLKGSKQLSQVVDSQDIKAMSFSAQMNACLLVDEKGVPLHDTFIWADTRAEEQVKQLVDKLGADRIHEITAKRAISGVSIYKLMWIREHWPDIYRKAYKMLQAKDFVNFKLTGRMVTDHSDASGAGAYDIRHGTWSEEIIEAAGVRKELFPEILLSVEPVGYLLPEVAKQMNLSPKTIVVTGGGDGPSAAVGAGCVENGRFFLTYGTSAWIGGTTDQPFFDKEKALFCYPHVIPNKYMPIGTMQSAGTTYHYIRKLFEDLDVPVGEYDNIVKKIQPGADGLIFLPYIMGERSPIWNPKASGTFLGIRPQHQKAHYARAVLEGVALHLEWILSYFREKQSIKEMVFTGGGAVSPVLRQIFADIFNVNFLVPENIQESTSIAAAVMAGIGSGYYQSFDCLEKFLKMREKTMPIEENVALYQKYIPVFRESYKALEKVMADLEKLRN